MKKITLVLSFIVFTSAMNSQKIGIGLRNGIGLNSASTDPSQSGMGSIMTPLNAALLAEIGIGKQFVVQPELGIASKGFTVANPGGSTDAKLNYLCLNVLPKFRLNVATFEVFAFVGPSLNKKLSAKYTYLGATNDITDVSEFNISLILGLGGAYKIGPGKIFLDGRYNRGISNVNPNSGVQFKLHQIGINVGYIYTI